MQVEWAVETDRKTLLRIMASLVTMAGAGARSLPLAGVRVRSAAGRLKAPVELSTGSNARSPSDGPEASVPGGVAGGSAPTHGADVPSIGTPLPQPPAGEVQDARATLPRFLYRTILKLLRPAEYAARRIVIAFSRDIRLPPPKPRPPKPLPVLRDGFGNPIVLPDGFRISGHLFRTSGRPIRTSGPPGAAASGSPKAPRRLSLPLVDPLPKFGRRFALRTAQPRIWVTGDADRRPVPPRPQRTDPIDASRLFQRIDAVVSALTNVDAHARRYARWRDRTRRALAEGKSCKRLQPLATGRLPAGGSGLRRELHDVLASTHRFAWYAINYPDDS